MNLVKFILKRPYSMKTERSFNGISFCFVTKKNGVYFQETCWEECRDSNVCKPVNTIKSKNFPSNSPYAVHTYGIDFKKVRIAVWFKRTWKPMNWTEEFRNKILNGYLSRSAKILSFFERMAGLSPSKIYEAEIDLPRSSRVFIFEGSGEWMRSPALISLYLLLIRCGKYPEFENLKTHRGFMKTVKVLEENYGDFAKLDWHERPKHRMSRWPYSWHRDHSYLKKIGPVLPILMKKRRKIFNKSKKACFLAVQAGYEGITRFINGETQDTESYENFIEEKDRPMCLRSSAD